MLFHIKTRVLLKYFSVVVVVDSSEQSKAKQKVWIKNVVAKIIHNEYKDALLNKKCLRHSTNRILSKNHKIGTCEINIISLSCFDDKFRILDNRFDALARGF